MVTFLAPVALLGGVIGAIIASLLRQELPTQPVGKPRQPRVFSRFAVTRDDKPGFLLNPYPPVPAARCQSSACASVTISTETMT